jgi:hypothetical protein
LLNPMIQCESYGKAKTRENPIKKVKVIVLYMTHLAIFMVKL